MKNITVAEICARMEGILNCTISDNFSCRLIVRPSRIYESSSSLFLTFFTGASLIALVLLLLDTFDTKLQCSGRDAHFHHIAHLLVQQSLCYR